ncbi:MAG TPA: glycosyltransferase [Acidimicrobiales bacterium]|nr:glycosyltransferase [Acidimicrobiales bacterium]
MTNPETGVHPVTRSTAPGDRSQERLAALEAKVTALESMVAGQAAWMTDLQEEVVRGLERMTGAADRLESHDEWLTSLQRWVSSCVKTLANFGAQPLDSAEPGASGTVDVMGSLMARVEVQTVMDWIASVADVPDGPLVSVTTATRNRPGLLAEAIDSVLGQSYQRFELVIMDDSDGEETQEQLAQLHDERVRVVRTPARRGAGAAFNVGLEVATGDIITFLDDDNLMHPEWLRSVVWAFTTFPDAVALYGARAVEDPGAQRGIRSGMLPALEFAHYDRERHERANYVDRNTMAFRSSLRHIRYDESLVGASDWDHSLRLFTEAEPLALPALSCYYRTVNPGRVSDQPDYGNHVRRVRSRTHTSRPLRVLVHSAMYPVISETYIGEDIDALERAGAVVAVSTVQRPVSAMPGVPPPRLDVGALIDEFKPDVALMHWTTHAVGELPLMERFSLPFACRVHSFDMDGERTQRLLDHPLCIAVFGYPHHLDAFPTGVVPFIPTVGPGTHIPASPDPRTLILSVSAGVPKKEFAFLAEAMAALPEVDRMIVLARTNGFEELPAAVQRLAAEADPSIVVGVNVPRAEVLEHMARASVLLYTLNPQASMGYPMSIVEAMLCGTIPIMPERPEARAIVGPSARTYRDRADIVRHVREVARGGPSVAEERRRLVELAQRHRDPEELGRLYAAMRERLTTWRALRV